uniref:IgGFc_binding domain-containing protein n=1 Tax=Rhabditophanes sp. KR3021 TaxID=114890 RepID=A0AC35UHF3_9BILA
MFESGFLTLHRPVEIETRFGEIMDALDINSAIGLITAGLNYKPQNDLYLMVPGMATRITSSGEYFPIYINSKSLDLVAFDRDSTIIQVKFDIQNVPCVTLNEGSQIPGYIYTFGVIRHGVTSSRIRQITLDIEIIKRTIIRLGYSYPGFSSMFPLPNLKLLLSPTYASLTLDKSMGLINAGLAIELHDLSVKKWLAVPAMGVNLNSKKNKFYPIYTDCDGNLHSFNESLHSFRVLISDDGSPVAMSPTNEIYLGFIVINDEEIMSTGVGRLSSVTIDYSFVLDAINFLGPRYTFYILAHPNGVASGTFV